MLFNGQGVIKHQAVKLHKIKYLPSEEWMKKPREAAPGILHEVLLNGAFSNDLLSQYFHETQGLSLLDRRFAERLVKTAIRHYLSLLEVLRAVSSVRPEKMKPYIREILLLGSCELLFMDTPAYAGINEYVSLTKKSGYKNLSGFVNAVLRKVSAEGHEILEKQEGAVRAGMPEELYEDIRSWYGDASDEIFTWFQKDDSEGIYIRRNRSRVTEKDLIQSFLQEGKEIEESPYEADCYLLKDPGNLSESAAFRNGYCTVQDLSSAVSTSIVRDLFQSGNAYFSVLDACASPGGKSLHAADLMAYDMPDAKKEILSCDVSEKKMERIRENADRCGFSFMRPMVQDAGILREDFLGRFDLVILDVPCSGIGVIRKRPEIRLHALREERRSLEKLQARILNVNAAYVKPGGTLLYSTCTVSPDENLLMIRSFLDQHPDYYLTGFRENLAESLRDEEGPDQGFFQIIPGKYGSDGFFMARMRKNI